MAFPVDPQKYLLFLGVMVVMAWFPGPANLFSIANGAQRGHRAALIGMVGMNVGTLCWFAAASIGLGALIATFPAVFKLLTVLGALYVAWLGLRSLWAAWMDDGAATASHVRLGRSAFRDGMAVQLTNPKVLLFFTAVLPPFLDLKRPFLPQLLAFGAATILMDVSSMSAYGLGGAALSARMTQPRFRRAFAGLIGLVLIAAAVLIALRA